MASALSRNLIESHTRITFGHSKFIPTKPLHPIHIGKPSLVQPLVAKNLMMTEPQFPFEEYRATKIKRVNKALDEAIPLDQHPTILHEAMRYSLLAGGNRVFSTLCIAACEVVGGNESLAMPMACALEMINTMAVIQDDLPCLDDDDLRRGKPANHKVFGEATSILACQALLCLAIEHIASKTKNVSSDRLVQAIMEICTAAGSRGFAGGQLMDMQSERKEVSLSELEFIGRHKTVKFLEAALVCGALVGGGTEVEIEKLRKYGNPVGLAYQVCNDILDATGSTEKLGKKVGGDLLRDKATFIKLMGVDESKKFARQLVAQANDELSYFDSTKAAPLYHIANFIVSQCD